jgi:hypothetical protein
MRHTVQLSVDEIPAALRRTAQLLGTTLFRVEHLSAASGAGQGPGCLTIVVEAPANAPVLELFTRALAAPRAGSAAMPRAAAFRPIRAGEPAEPFRWQADGAGDPDAG